MIAAVFDNNGMTAGKGITDHASKEGVLMKGWMGSCRGLAVGAIAALALHAAHADTAGLPERWLEWRNNYAVYPQALAECGAFKGLAAEWDQNLQRLAAAIARSGGAVPPGVFAEFKGTMGTGLQDGQPCQGRPLMGTVAMGYWPERVIATAPGARPTLKRDHGEHFILTLWLNTFTGVDANRAPDFLRAGNGWNGMGLVSQSGSFQGLPVINGRVVVITPPGHAPAYVPVPLERALKLWIPAQAQAVRDAEALVQQYPAAQREATRRQTVAPAQALLAQGQALLRQGEAVLKGPAYLKLDREAYAHVIVAAPGPDTSAIVMPNPTYFDARLPRSAVQLILLSVEGLKLDEPAVHNGDAFDSTFLTRKFVETVDWKAIARSELR